MEKVEETLWYYSSLGLLFEESVSGVDLICLGFCFVANFF